MILKANLALSLLIFRKMWMKLNWNKLRNQSRQYQICWMSRKATLLELKIENKLDKVFCL